MCIASSKEKWIREEKNESSLNDSILFFNKQPDTYDIQT